MSYVHKIIGLDERLIGVSRLHWIYTLQGLLWFTGLAVVGVLIDQYLWAYFGNRVPFYRWALDGFGFDAQHTGIKWLFAGAGLYIFLVYFIKTLATEVALTSRRVIYKTGLIFVEVEEIELEEIKGEHIHHGLLGRFLKYGAIDFDCRFIGDVSLPAIRKPYRFIKALHVARSRVVDSMAYAISSVQGGGREVRRVPEIRQEQEEDGQAGKKA
ncbi:MAG: PH domain-containing protein [Rhodospirillales bacterium]|nr:PH domain-containing protein [Alphaproteobacteria bacterium]USO03899.1 MAG: PH domain-containing protein [Rhodospirillales bacterium]